MRKVFALGTSVLLAGMASNPTALARDESGHLPKIADVLGVNAQPFTGSTREDLHLYIERLAASPEMFRTIVPKLFALSGISGPYEVPVVPFTLQSKKIGKDDVYFIERPCSPKDVVTVAPWWDVSTTVKVCSDSYRPEVNVDNVTGVPQRCEATYLPFRDMARTPCACGDHLINCARDNKQHSALIMAQYDEVIETMALVMRQHRNFGDVLTMNETVRSDYAEFNYERMAFFETGKWTLPTLSETPTLRRRRKEFTGGVLTTPLYVSYDPSRRGTLSYVWQDFLCSRYVSVNVTARQMFDVSPNLRTRDHAELEKMTGCKECHARLENALRAFLPFGLPHVDRRFHQEGVVAKEIGFFVRDSNDLRARGPATPEWIGTVMSHQPEFSSCMAKRSVELAYGGSAPPPGLEQELTRKFASNGDLLATIEEAFARRYFPEKQ